MLSRTLVAAAMFLLSVLLYVDRTCISVAKGAIQKDLHLSDTEMGFVFSAFSLGYALLQPVGGGLADRFGPRVVLATIVTIWSFFTGLTAVVRTFVPLLIVRFLFGAGEAGAFPAMARATYSWFPPDRRGLIQGISFSGSRIGAAFAMPLLGFGIERWGWREVFVALMLVGFVWAVLWGLCFRDSPRSASPFAVPPPPPKRHDVAASGRGIGWQIARSGNVWLMCAQYFCSNFTFFFCLTWLYPHIKEAFGLSSVNAGWLASAPLLAGAFGNWTAGLMVDSLFRAGRPVWSRRLPAVIGFILAAVGMYASTWQTEAIPAVCCLSLAVFGADMTLAPSWAFCIDIGGRRSGLISGLMNMAGNIGSFVTSLAFPLLRQWAGVDPAAKGLTSEDNLFFYVAAGLNLLAAVLWFGANPTRTLIVEPPPATGAEPST